MSAIASPPSPDLATDLDLRALNARFEGQPPEAVIAWAVERFGSGLCLAASMTDTALIDLAIGVDPDIEVVFLDTGFHFAETLGTLRRAMTRHALRVNVLRPEATATSGEPGAESPRIPDPWTDGVEACCRARKTIPLDRLLAGRTAWMSGLRQADSPERAGTPVVELDRRGLIKINPLAGWTDADVERHHAEHGTVLNPLLFQGFPSIGCWPCTEAVGPDGGRSGRWAGEAKTECGIHR